MIINNEEKTVSSKNDVGGKLDSCMQKNQTGLLFHTKYKNELKVDSRFKCKSWTHKTSRRKLAVNFLTLVLAIFLRYVSSVKRNKSKNKQMRLHQTKNLLHNKGNYQQKPKGHLMNGRRYLQMIYLIRAWYPKYTKK